MSGYYNFFDVLSDEDIDEKIDLNIKTHKYDLITFRKLLQNELAQNKRLLLKLESEYYLGKFDILSKFLEEALPYKIQICNLEEQISHVEYRMFMDRRT